MATKKCTNCGSELSEDTRFCSVCGTPVIAETAQEAAPEAAPEQSPAAEQPSSPTPMETLSKSASKAFSGAASTAVNLTKDMGKYKKFTIPAAAVLALVIVIIIAAIAMAPSKYETLKNSISINSNDEEVVIK